MLSSSDNCFRMLFSPITVLTIIFQLMVDVQFPLDGNYIKIFYRPHNAFIQKLTEYDELDIPPCIVKRHLTLRFDVMSLCILCLTQPYMLADSVIAQKNMLVTTKMHSQIASVHVETSYDITSILETDHA